MTKEISKRKIGLVTKETDASELRRLWPQFQKLNVGASYYMEPSLHKALKPGKTASAMPIQKMASTCDLLIAVGGDGTILRCAHHLLEGSGWKTASLLGINLGHLGFLSSLNATHFMGELKKILTMGTGLGDERSCLQVSVKRGSKSFKQYHVLNDGVLSKGSLSRIFEFHIEVNGEFLSSYRADGLIVASPTGSTAYNLAAGGSIIEPRIPAIQLTPICAQYFSNKPIVISDQNTIGLSVGRHSSDVFLTLDGQIGLKIEETDKIEIKKSPKTIRFLLPPGGATSHYFHSLRQKLKWGLVSSPTT